MTHRPALQRVALLFALPVLFVVLVAAIVMSAKPDNNIQQNFYGPVNAPVNTCLSADQEVDLQGKVGR